MSKELEALEIIGKLYLINDEQVKDWDKRDFNILKSALHRLESIDNSEPSEALEDLEALEQDIKDRVILAEDRQLKLCAVIKQALLKAQEPKHYLKWEDLEKFKDKDSVKVKMNDTELSLIIQIDCLNDIYVQLYKEKEDGNCVNLLSDFFRNKELFNNLRLELLE